MNSPTLPAYLIAKIRVEHLVEYLQGYGTPVLPLLNAAGAEILVASAIPGLLEGDWDCDWTVVIRFPSKSVAMQWYTSADYAPFRKLRMNELTEGGSLVLFEGLDPTAFS